MDNKTKKRGRPKKAVTANIFIRVTEATANKIRTVQAKHVLKGRQLTYDQIINSALK